MSRRTHATVRFVGALVVAVTASNTLWGYVFFQPPRRWADGVIVMHEQLGGPVDLVDGSRSWNEAFEPALALWNNYLDRVRFAAVRDSTAPIGNPNGVNNVYFSPTFFGRNWDDCCLAAAQMYLTAGSRTVETDIIFNVEYTWNSYRGDVRRDTNARGGFIAEIRRVGLHEVGHVLGLTHPDEFGQSVPAVMNRAMSRQDALSADDIMGAQALYAVNTGSGAIIAFPPRDELLNFRLQLETKYRDTLQRPPGTTFVDNEGAVIWTQEYFRYRVNLCDHSTAVVRVLTEIDTGGVIGVCGGAPGGTVVFPPRNEALEFRHRLEAKYRDDLRRTAAETSVDLEGEVVWTQEYLRYRVNACSHGDAVQRVFLQIDGAGIQPVCR